MKTAHSDTFANPDPVICICGYAITRGAHSNDCPMGQFVKYIEIRTSRRCAEIAVDVACRQNGPQVGLIIEGEIKREFGLVSE